MSLSRNQKITIGIGIVVGVVALLNLLFGSGILLSGNVNFQEPTLSKIVLAEGIAIILLYVIVSLQLVFSLMESGRRHEKTPAAPSN